MAEMTPEQFGSHIRQKREAKGITLRKFAKMLDISPAYLSKAERGGERLSAAMVSRIAELLQLDGDGLLGKAGKVAPDVMEIILSDPAHWARVIRTIARQQARLDEGIVWQDPADFIRRIHDENGGPNDKIRGMRERYNEARCVHGPKAS